MKRVYISGKIGEEVISEATRLKFARAEGALRAEGYDVFNPCDEKWQATLRRDYEKEKLSPGSLLLQGKFPTFYAYALLRDMMVLATKDAVYFLDDWNKSPGATSEYYYAKATGKRMLLEDMYDACEYLVSRMYKEVKADNPPGEYLEMTRSDAEIAYGRRNLDEAWLPIK